MSTMKTRDLRYLLVNWKGIELILELVAAQENSVQFSQEIVAFAGTKALV